MQRLTMMTVLAGLLATSAAAQQQTYDMRLGQRHLGTLTFEGSGADVHLLSRLDNTPLGVADGTFEAVARSRDGQVEYLGVNRGSKTRDIAITRQGGTVGAVTVNPASDRTDLSDVARVPTGTLTPAEAFGVLANGATCPAPLTMYDGRRVVQMATTAMADTGGSVTCDMSYRVVAGKGHLSPFNFKALGMQAEYRSGALARITVSAGGFDVSFVRQ